ncbi:CHAT domain-containing protein, partial [Eubacteriales bacterium OttesenSCG-928-A19]|nr:CHAT domain-containing protein [Eubacteriales bacterium OttesenSCG-928-A19]
LVVMPLEGQAALRFVYGERNRVLHHDRAALEDAVRGVHGESGHRTARDAGLALRRALPLPSLALVPGAALTLVSSGVARKIPWEALYEPEARAHWGTLYAIAHALPGADETDEPRAPLPVSGLVILQADEPMIPGEPSPVDLAGAAPESVDPAVFAPLLDAARACVDYRGMIAAQRLHWQGAQAERAYYRSDVDVQKPGGNSVVLYLGHIVYDAQGTPAMALNASELLPDSPVLEPDFARLLSLQGGVPMLVVLCACGPEHATDAQASAILAERLIGLGARGVVLAERRVHAPDAAAFLAEFFAVLRESQARQTVPECLRAARERLHRRGALTDAALAFQYWGARGLRLRPARECEGSVRARARRVLAAAVVFALALWMLLSGVPGPGEPRLTSVKADWDAGVITVAASLARDTPLSAAAFIEVGGRYYPKPSQAAAFTPLGERGRVDIKIFVEPTDQKLGSVTVFLVRDGEADLADFTAHGSLHLDTPDYVLDSVELSR